MEEIFKKYPLLKDKNVPRETFIEFEIFVSMLQQRNDQINIISKKTAKNEIIRERHIVDSAQIIEFVGGGGCYYNRYRVWWRNAWNNHINYDQKFKKNNKDEFI